LLIINKGTAFKAIFVLHNRYIKRLIYIMYSNMASRQWFIGVKSNTDKQKNRLRHPYTDFKSRRAKSVPAVSRTNLAKTLCRSRTAVRRVAAPYKVHMRKIVQISQAEGICPTFTALSEVR